MRNNFRDSVSNAFEQIAGKIEMSTGYKLLLSGILGAVCGSGFLGFMSEYATYTYTTAYGFRLPAEGVPYLSITITALSFLTFIIAGLIFFISYFIFSRIKNYLVRSAKNYQWVLSAIIWILKLISKDIESEFEKISLKTKELEDKLALFYKNLSFNKFLILSIIIIIICDFIIFLFSSYSLFFSHKLSSVELKRWFVVVNTIIFLFMLFNWKPSLVWWISTTLTLIILAFFLAQMFNPSIYSAFLRTIRYGGGIEISVKKDVKMEQGQEQNLKCYLLLRTKQSLILYDKNSKEITELKWKDVASIHYEPNPNYKMPKEISIKEIFKIIKAKLPTLFS